MRAFPTPNRNGKTPAAPEWDRWRFFEITLASRGFAVLRLASLKLLTHAGCYAGGSPVLAVPSCTGVCGGPTHPPPSPRSREGRHHGDRLAGLPTPFIRLGGARRPRATGGAVCYSVVWVQYGIESGGGSSPRGDDAPFVTIPRRVLLTNYPTFCQQFRALPFWLKRDGVFFILQTERQIFLQ